MGLILPQSEHGNHIFGQSGGQSGCWDWRKAAHKDKDKALGKDLGSQAGLALLIEATQRVSFKCCFFHGTVFFERGIPLNFVASLSH